MMLNKSFHGLFQPRNRKMRFPCTAHRPLKNNVFQRPAMKALLLPLLFPFALQAGEVDVVDARAVPGADGWTFHVTLKHADRGWEHYADAWEVLSPDDRLLAKRTLYHPHVNEQPFTRSLSHVQVPEGTPWVLIRGHDKVHGYGGRTIRLDWPPAGVNVPLQPAAGRSPARSRP